MIQTSPGSNKQASTAQQRLKMVVFWIVVWSFFSRNAPVYDDEMGIPAARKKKSKLEKATVTHLLRPSLLICVPRSPFMGRSP